MKPLVPDADGGSTAADQGYSGRRAASHAHTGRLRVILRADAGRTQGTGHVMRLLTLAEELRDRGHDVILASAEIDVPWLAEAVRASGVRVVASPRDEIDAEALVALNPDWVVVDSYLVPASQISGLDARVPVLLLADGDARGAQASLYLDQNLAAPPLAGVDERVQLRGAAFALVRRAIRDVAIHDPVPVRHTPPRVVVVLGGTDPDDRTIDVAASCVRVGAEMDVVFVAPLRQHDRLRRIGAGWHAWRVLAPTPELPTLLGGADVIVSAGGTSAWDVASIGTPSVLLAVVTNQQASLKAIVDQGVALGFDVVDAAPDLDRVAQAIELLLTDRETRRRLVAACRELFDGRGAARVAEALERHPRTSPGGSRP